MSTSEEVRVRGWSVPKAGEERNSDRWRWSRRTGKVAVADGATVSSYSDRWADILARGFVWSSLECVEDRNAFAAEIVRLQQQWHETVPWTYLEKKGWNYILKAQQGAHATFLGVIVAPGKWRACAVGDSSLFVVDDAGEVQLCWPAEESTEFSNYPDLIPSVSPQPLSDIVSGMKHAEGPLDSGTNLVLCTDALAAHLLLNRGDSVLWERLLLLRYGGIDGFQEFVADLRRDGMKNDDTTLVIVRSSYEW